jgi:hypothetical protein
MLAALFKIYFDRTLKGWHSKYIKVGLQAEDDILYVLHFADEETVRA